MKKLYILLLALCLCTMLFSCDVKEPNDKEAPATSTTESVADSTDRTPSTTDSSTTDNSLNSESNTISSDEVTDNTIDNSAETSKDSDNGNADYDDNISGEIAMTVCENYEEYLRFVESDSAVKNFVTYETIKALGEFVGFACYGSTSNSFDSYYYKIQVDGGVLAYLYIYHYERQSQRNENFVTGIDTTDFRTAKTNGKSSVYENNGIKYHYRANGNLSRIEWSIAGTLFSLEGELYKSSLFSDNKITFPLLLAEETAKGELEKIFSSYPEESVTVDTYEEYLVFVQNENLDDDFVLFDEIDFLGNFVGFLAYGSLVNGYEKYQYFLDSNGVEITLEIDHSEKELLKPNLDEEYVNLEKMTFLRWKEDSGIFNGVYEKDGVRYNYLNMGLASIAWQMNGVSFKLFATNSNVLSLTEQAPAFKLLNATIAANFIKSKGEVASDSQDIDSGEEKLTSLMPKWLTEEERELLYNKELYESKVDIENKAIIKVYDTLTPLSKCTLSLDEIIAWAESIDTITYVVLNENNDKLRICNDENGIRIVVIETSYKGATFAEDLKSLGGTVEIFDEAHSVEAVHCFDDLSSHGGFYAYYVTDGGIFVRYYENAFAEGTWFTESDFAKYGTAYYKHITSYEYNHNENGELLSGSTSLLEYINKIYGTGKDYGAK